MQYSTSRFFINDRLNDNFQHFPSSKNVRQDIFYFYLRFIERSLAMFMHVHQQVEPLWKRKLNHVSELAGTNLSLAVYTY